VAAPKVVSAKCPTCGAHLPVPPGVPQVTCRYCQNVIHVEHRKPPPNVQPFGTPGAMPSRTLYVDPAGAAKAGKTVGCIIAVVALVPILIPVLIGVGPWAMRSCKGAVKPFPVACGTNEDIEVSGNYEGTGPIVTSVGHNCKLHIKNAKLKGSTLVKAESFNMELTLDNVTIETTEAMVRGGSNLKVKLHGSTLTSQQTVFDGDSNMEIDVEDSTIESKAGVGVKSKYNLKVRMENGKIRGKKAGIDTDANLVLSLKKASEITSSDGVGVKTSSSLKLEAEGGKIDGAEGGLVVSSGADINATGFTISSKEKAITATSSLKLDYTDGAITSLADIAIDGDSSMELTLANTKIQGASTAINCESSSKIKATKKTRIVGTSGNGITTSSNTEVNLVDAAIEAGDKAFKGTVNDKIKLGQGARMAGKKGGVLAEGNFSIEATGATLEGGSGPGLVAGYNARVSFKQGVIKGTPALQFERKPSPLELDGTRVEGEQKVPAR
jgi:hypothetical protein